MHRGIITRFCQSTEHALVVHFAIADSSTDKGIFIRYILDINRDNTIAALCILDSIFVDTSFSQRRIFLREVVNGIRAEEYLFGFAY